MALVTKISWGIVGPGGIARRFAEELQHSRAGTWVAVARRSPSRAQSFAASFGPEVRAHASYPELFADPGVGAVYVATLHSSHVALAIAALEAGKHVICEKPAWVDHAGALAVIEAAHRNGRYYAEGFMYRFHPQTIRLAELVRDGAIGDVQHIEFTLSFAPELPAGHRLTDANLAGGGVGGNLAEAVSLSAKDRIGPDGVDECATAALGFPHGITAQVSCGVRLAGRNQTVVHGSHGTITVADPWLPSTPDGSDIVVARAGEPVETIHIAPAHQYLLEADAVAEFAAQQQSPSMSWAATLGNAQVLDSWRSTIGLQYPFEADSAPVPTASGRPLERRDDAAMHYGTVAGVAKQVSRLVMGCDNQETLGHASVMFDDFFERGGKAFDTAYIYCGGRQEQLLGQWVANRGVRKDVSIIGKGAHTPYCDPASLARQLEESLERLQSDHVDLYMMHRDNPEIPVGEFVDILNDLLGEGKLRAFGGSNWTPARFVEANAYAAKHGKRALPR